MRKIVLNVGNRLAKEKCNNEFAGYFFNYFLKHWDYKASLDAIVPYS